MEDNAAPTPVLLEGTLVTVGLSALQDGVPVVSVSPDLARAPDGPPLAGGEPLPDAT